jgi:uncharacterized membrane protein
MEKGLIETGFISFAKVIRDLFEGVDERTMAFIFLMVMFFVAIQFICYQNTKQRTNRLFELTKVPKENLIIDTIVERVKTGKYAGDTCDFVMDLHWQNGQEKENFDK